MRYILGLLLFTQVCAFASEDKYAPLPAKVVAAKTVIIENKGNTKFVDSVYKALQKWGRWKIVTDKSSADLILVVDYEARAMRGDPSITILDRESGEQLWIAHREVHWGTWTGIANGVVNDLKKRMPADGRPSR